MRFCCRFIVGLSLLCLPTNVFSAPFDAGFTYGEGKVRGVSLGGWLLIEPFITPSLFDNTKYDAIVDARFANTKTEKPRQISLKSLLLGSITSVSGFWAFDVDGEEPYILRQLPYLQNAIEWAAKHNLQVMIDLHGAPGSQNSYDNSGLTTENPSWHIGSRNIERTKGVIKKIATTYKVASIAVLNEPAGWKSTDILNAAKTYSQNTYEIIRQQSNAYEVISDAYQSLSSWQGLMPEPQYSGVIIDAHYYEIFLIEGNELSEEDAIQKMCSHGQEMVNSQLTVIAGEGSRFNGTLGNRKISDCRGFTGPASAFDDHYKEFLRKFWEAQTSSYEKGAGWIMWTWKTESADEWSYKAGTEHGLIPRNPAERKYPSICG